MLEKLTVIVHLLVDMLQINGNVDKNEKSAFIRLITSVGFIISSNSRVMEATIASNTINHQSQLQAVFRAGFPHCILMSLQELRDNACHPGKNSAFSVFTDLWMFEELLLTILITLKKKSNQPPDYHGLN